MGFAVGADYGHAAADAIAKDSRTNRLLPMPGGPTMVTTHPVPPTALIEKGGDRVEFPFAANEWRIAVSTGLVLTDLQQPNRAHRISCP